MATEYFWDSEISFAKGFCMNIQWFPGHMAKTRRLIEENLKLVDICIEIVDARLVLSSKSPLVDELISNKPRLLIVNKSDLADERINAQWEDYFKENKINAVFVNSRDGGKLLSLITNKILAVLSDEIKKWNEKGMSGRNIRAMVTGVPNVGKSTFINNLSGRKSAKTGDRPGVTTGKQWIRAGKIEMLDTPGILCPKFEDEKMGLHLAFSGAIKDDVYDTGEVCVLLLEFLRDNYSDALAERFKIDVSAEDMGYEILEKICKKRGFILRGGDFDYDRACSIILDEFRSAKIGRISLEKPLN